MKEVENILFPFYTITTMLLVIHIKMMVKEDEEKNFSLTKSRIIPAAPSFAPRTTLAATEAW